MSKPDKHAMFNLTIIVIVLIILMLTYIVTTEQNIRRYRKIIKDLP